MTANLRQRLRDRQRRSVTYPLAVVDTADAEAALARARSEYQRAVLTHGEGHADVDTARQAVETAEAREAECYEHVVVRALAADEFEALVDAHPATDGETDRVPWRTATFRPALLAACVDSDMTEDDWAAFFAEQGSYGDRVGIYNAALEVNTRSPAPSVPKDSTPTSS